MTEEKAASLSTTVSAEKPHNASKKGLIYLSSIPPYMNVTKVREIFEQFGKVGRIYLQLSDKEIKHQEKKKKKRKVGKKFSEGWVEFEKKCVAKRVANLLNNTQVNSRKSSMHYDYMWNIKYLSNFKWNHLTERLTYEKAERNKTMKAEIQLSKKKSNFFSSNIDKKKSTLNSVNKEYENLDSVGTNTAMDMEEEKLETRDEFLKSLIG